MKKACSKCGKIHDRKYICVIKGTAQERAESLAYSFRNKQVWKRKSYEIRDRDMHLCQVCLRGHYNTRKIYNSADLSVHHIVSLASDYERRLDNSNLITLCRYHHELAELGRIPVQELLSIAADQEIHPMLSPLPLPKSQGNSADTYSPPLYIFYSQNENEKQGVMNFGKTKKSNFYN